MSEEWQTKVDLDRELVECNAMLEACKCEMPEHGRRLVDYNKKRLQVL